MPPKAKSAAAAKPEAKAKGEPKKKREPREEDKYKAEIDAIEKVEQPDARPQGRGGKGDRTDRKASEGAKRDDRKDQ